MTPVAKNSRKDKHTPTIPGYYPVRRDRQANIKRGGLIFYIRETILHVDDGYINEGGQEISSIRVRLNKKKWIPITNFYLPPPNSSGQRIEFNPSIIPFSSSSLICGDFNAHHPVWDAIQPEDSRGSDTLEWACSNNLHILNDTSPTRHNRATGNGSSPDITVAGSTWANKCAWAVDNEEIGGSDHLPIIITVHSKIKHQPITSATPRWRSNGIDWVKFREAVEKNISKSSSHSSLKKRADSFTNAILKAAHKHVGKVKPKKRDNPRMTPKLQRLIKKRNSLRKSIGTKRKEWLAACTEVSKAKLESKAEQWEEIISSALGDINERGMWQLIKSLNGTPATNSPNEAMKIGGKTVVSAKRKAEAFAQHYASVSRYKLNKQQRAVTRQLKKLTRPNKQFEIPDFTLEELQKAITKMRRKGAPGPDDITPAFLKELGPLALRELLGICNQSLRDAECPQAWRNAIIIPLLKSGKSPSDLASYRPVSLTSCIAKVAERMIAERLYYLADENKWFSNLQAGFRQGYSCMDQIIRLSQAIEDGFQSKKMKRSVMVLLDYSKAFDTVWRSRLLTTMAEKGVPLEYIKWLYCFLQNRQASVRIHGASSSTKRLQQGVPQGCVLSPLLFVFFINNVVDRLMQEDPVRARQLVISLFADDVTVLATNVSRDQAIRDVQWAVNVISDWSKEWMLQLNANKSEVAFFTKWSHEASFKPTINVENKAIPFNPTPKLLGVRFDTSLTFNPHAEEVARAASGKLGLLAAVGNTSWGWDKYHLRQLYFTYLRSKMDYSGAGWQPWLSASSISTLERTQNKALRVMTGQLKSTPVEALRLESSIPSYETHIKRNILKSHERAKRLPEDHPSNIALKSAIPSKNLRQSWARKGKELEAFLPPEAANREPITITRTPPWESRPQPHIQPFLKGITNKSDDQNVIRAAAETAISEWNSDLTIYTDGSAVAGCSHGGAGAVVHIHDDPPRYETLKSKGAAFTSSFEEECAALILAIDWINDNCVASSRPLIITDSQSLCRALIGYDKNTAPIRSRIDKCKATVGIQWVPGHCGIPGNEMADAAANEARTIRGPRRNTSIKGIIPAIKMNIVDPPCRPQYAHIKEAYSKLSMVKEKQITSRWDAVYLARLRTGHHWDLRTYLHRITKDTEGHVVEPICPRCLQADDDTPHLFNCVGTLAVRQELFGTVDVNLCALSEFPLQSIALARRTLRGVGAGAQDTTAPVEATQ